ncbi:hypothetical protein DXG03_007357, partial [Asterophora parasitica]
TGWGTRAGIGDASAATAAMDAEAQRNEKPPANNNNPYGRQEFPSEPYSPFRDQSPSPFSDVQTPNTATPAYSSRQQGGLGGVRRRAGDEEVEMQVGYAR